MNRCLVHVATFVNRAGKDVKMDDSLTRLGVHHTRQDLKYCLERMYDIQIEPEHALKWMFVDDVVKYIEERT